MIYEVFMLKTTNQNNQQLLTYGKVKLDKNFKELR